MATDPMERIRTLDRNLMTGVRRKTAAYRPRTVKPEAHSTGWSAPKPDSGGSDKKPADIAPWYRKFFKWGLWFCLIAIVFAGVSFLRGSGGISARLVDVAIVAPTFADGGTELSIDVTVQNRNRAAIEDAKLIVSYAAPRPDEPQARETITRDLGEVSSGGNANESFSVTLFGEEGTERTIDARLEFGVADSNATFTKTESQTITIRSSPVRLNIQNPAEVVPNQPVTLTIAVSPNTTDPLGTTIVRLRTPAGWEFTSSDPAPSIGSDTWDLGELVAGQEKIVKVTGTLSGAPGELATLVVSVGRADPNDARGIGVLYQERPVVMELSRSFLDASLSVRDETGSTVSIPASGAEVTVKYTNPSATAINNGVVTLTFGGPALDIANVESTDGFFDTNTKTMTFSFTDNQDLRRIDPAATGEFSVRVVPNPQAQGTNRFITISAAVAGDVSGVHQTVQGIDTIKLSVAADARLLSDTFSHSGPIQNTGPIPPHVGTKTTYTLKWKLSGVTSALRDATVRTTLPSYVTWTNASVVSTGQPTMTYNSATREVIWKPDTVAAGAEPEAAFQVAVIPSGSQQGSTIPLSGVVSFSAQDASLSTAISQTRPAHTTNLTGSEAALGSGTVAPAGGGQ